MLRRVSSVGAVFLTLWLLSAPPPARAADKDGRLPVPPRAEQEAARRELRAASARDRTAAASGDRQQRRQRLLNAANDAKDRAAYRFAAFEEVIDLAVADGDPAGAMAAVDGMARAFAIDDYGRRSEDALGRFLHPRATPDQCASVAANCLLAVHHIVSQGDCVPAARMGALAARAAKRSRRGYLIGAAEGCRTEVDAVRRLYDAAQGAAAKLSANPADPDANRATGTYLYFCTGERERGLKALSAGGDRELKDVAAREAGPPATPEEQFALAESLWRLGEQRGRQLPVRHVRARAVEWYRRAMAGLPQRQQQFAEDRCKEAGIVDLLPLVDVSRDAARGTWASEGTGVRCAKQPGWSALRLPYRAPAAYDVTVSFTCLGHIAHNELGVMLTQGGQTFAWSYGAWATKVGFNMVGGRGWGNPATSERPALALNRPYLVRVEVRGDRATAFLDGVQVAEWTQAMGPLTLHGDWRLPGPAALQLWSYETEVRFDRIEVREISGPGEFRRG